jgi:hypothetical protein
MNNTQHFLLKNFDKKKYLLKESWLNINENGKNLAFNLFFF